MSDERFIDNPPAGEDGWREVWNHDLRYRLKPSRFEWLLGVVRRLFRSASEEDAERQRNFNVAVLDLLRDARAHADANKKDLHGDFQNDINVVQRSLAEGFASSLATETARLHELTLVAARRNDALIAALDQKIESVAVRVRDAVNPVVSPSSSDVLYRRLEDALRGSEAEVRADVSYYLTLARDHQPVLDAGCGRGEFLEACRDSGIEARGVDSNERSVADLKQRNLAVSLAGIPECFSGVPSGSLGSILAMHVVEHLPVDALFSLFREAARVLRPGGLLMIETPNAESILISASDFWRDPTHLAPRHPAALTTLGREHDFEIAEIRAIHEVAEGARIAILPTDPPELQRVVHAINDRLFAPQDLRLVLRSRVRVS